MRLQLRKMFVFRESEIPGGTMGNFLAKAGGAVMNDEDSRRPWRYPAPASAPVQGRIPQGTRKRVYDITYYPRDTRRNSWHLTEPIENGFHEKARALIESHGLVEDAEEKQGSPGNNNPAVMWYDPTGLRTSMTANTAAFEDALAMATPTQLVRNGWEYDSTEIVDDYTGKGLPPVPGRRLETDGAHPHKFRPRW